MSKKFTTLSQQPAENWNILQQRIWTKKKAMAANNLTSLFQIQTSPTMPSPEPLYGFKYSPWLSVSTLAMSEPFFKYNPFPMALFVAFCAKVDPTPDSAPVTNVERTVFAKIGRAFAAKERSLPKLAGPLRLNQLKTKGTRPLFSYCEQPDVYSFLLWCLFHPDKLLSFCSLVNWSKQEHHLHTNLRSQDECSQDSLYQRHVSIFAVDFQKCLLIRLCKTCLLYVIKFLSSDIWLSGFLHEVSIVFRFGLGTTVSILLILSKITGRYTRFHKTH